MLWGAVANLGTVRPKTLPNGLVRWLIDFGRRGGKHRRVYSVPSAADKRPIALANQETAQQVLEAIRAEIRNGRTLDQVLATYQGRNAPEDLVENRLTAYLQHWEAIVEGGKRSPGSIRELRRYASAGGHFDFWREKSVRSITYADIEDFHLWLANRVSPTSAAQKEMKANPGDQRR